VDISIVDEVGVGQGSWIRQWKIILVCPQRVLGVDEIYNESGQCKAHQSRDLFFFFFFF